MASTVEEEEGSEEVKKPVKEVPVVQDEGLFVHVTGDKYDGFFEAKKKDRTARMHGPGAYTTAEGDVYTGSWEGDKLGANAEVTITYSDGSKYEGMFKDWSYAGRGKYIYPDGCVVLCEFLENCPIGHMVLTDPNGHLWLGQADNGFVWFDPLNHYYQMLEKTRGSKSKISFPKPVSVLNNTLPADPQPKPKRK